MTLINNTCLSALLCGAVIVALPAMAQNTGAAAPTAGAVTGTARTSSSTGIGAIAQPNTGTMPPAGAMTNEAQADANAATAETNLAANGQTKSTGGMTSSGDINSPTASNNAGSVNGQTQTPAQKMNNTANGNANAAINESASPKH